MDKLRFGILSAGNISSQMVATISKMDEVVAYAVAARDLERALALAKSYSFAKAYGSYEELYEDEDVDVIYIGSPHSHHYAHAKECLLHGKHVVCEKTFTMNAAQAKELCNLAKKKKLFIMEAIWTRYMPFVGKLRSLLESGEIGKVTALHAQFGVYHPTAARLYDPALGGGALLDVGIYPLTFASIVLGDDIVEIKSSAVKTDLGVDGQNGMLVTYREGRFATLTSSILSQLCDIGVVYGEKGRVELDKFWQAQSMRVFRSGNTQPEVIEFPFEISGYEYEIRAAVKNIAAGRLEPAEMPHAQMLQRMRLMDSLRREWGIVYPAELEKV